MVMSTTSDTMKKYYIFFPQNLYALSKIVKSNVDFMKYVLCTKCFSLYDYSECFTVVEGNRVTKNCSFVEFQNHRLPQFRRPCNQPLLYEVALSSKKVLKPYKIFCYKSLKSSLNTFVQRDNFEDMCETWRYCEKKDGILYDVYDGRMWAEFNGGKYDFFSQEGNYGLMLNVDWFQLYKHTNRSIGVIYLAVLNLPRVERFKRENIILVGVIPDMKSEPKTNTFLYPFVQELEEAWTRGFWLKSHNSAELLKYFKLALTCVGCDVPASRK